MIPFLFFFLYGNRRHSFYSSFPTLHLSILIVLLLSFLIL
jgi:hypothetical protein